MTDENNNKVSNREAQQRLMKAMLPYYGHDLEIWMKGREDLRKVLRRALELGRLDDVKAIAYGDDLLPTMINNKYNVQEAKAAGLLDDDEEEEEEQEEPPKPKKETVDRVKEAMRIMNYEMFVDSLDKVVEVDQKPHGAVNTLVDFVPSSQNFEAEYEYYDALKTIRKTIENLLTEKEFKIFTMMYPSNKEEGASLQEIADTMGLTKARTRQIYYNGMHKIENSEEIKMLYEELHPKHREPEDHQITFDELYFRTGIKERP